ncbi:alpha/beta hydrolase [Pedobacter sp. BS3]|uniref:alpha/beta hydrolase n=1 Tax=Pedobacter sp. BS3 TaxID=2567937 RepID=UPI0016590F5A|nr:alpha/beta hydrolase [Pedobacter sp. BS3]
MPVIVKGTLPVYLFIHGGGFSGGDKKGTEAFCSKLASFGYAVVSINYRLYLKHHKIPGASCSANMSKGLPSDGKFNPALEKAIKIASEDAQMALAWIKQHTKAHNLNSSSIVISGGSAGAITALYTAYASNQNILKIKAVVDLWGGLETSDVIKKGAPPLLIFHGDEDKLIHIDYAYALKKRMDEIGNSKTEIHIMKGKGHARYDLITNERMGELVSFLQKL